jgi:hypothetical protein
MTITAKILIGLSLLIAVVALGVGFAAYGNNSGSGALGAAGPVQNTPWWFYNGIAIGHGDTPNHQGGTIKGIIKGTFSNGSLMLGAYPSATSTAIVSETLGGVTVNDVCLASQNTAPTGVQVDCSPSAANTVSLLFKNGSTTAQTVPAGTITIMDIQ